MAEVPVAEQKFHPLLPIQRDQTALQKLKVVLKIGLDGLEIVPRPLDCPCPAGDHEQPDLLKAGMTPAD